MSTHQTTIIRDDWLALPMPKSTVCILRRQDILKHLPDELLLDGFRRGKQIKRRMAMLKRRGNEQEPGGGEPR